MSALVVSSGVANAYTGVDGIADARKMAAITSSVLDVPEEEVLVASTGLIGKKLDMPLIEDQIKKVARTLEHSTEGASRAANAILTTDRSAKEIAVVVGGGDSRVKIGAMAKGAGMLEPNMATMLAYVFTDAQLPTATLENLLRDAVDISFNMMTVDGDMSTNDMVLLTSVNVNGRAEDYGDMKNSKGVPERDIVDMAEVEKNLKEGLDYVCTELAKMMVMGAEGATTMITVNVHGAQTDMDARRAAKAVANSILVKTAVFGRDPNWGRIIAALGYSGAEVKEETLSITIAGISLVQEGIPSDITKAEMKQVMDVPELVIDIDLGIGEYSATAYGCDLTDEYIRINSEFST